MAFFRSITVMVLICFGWAKAQATHINKFYGPEGIRNDLSIGYGLHSMSYNNGGTAEIDVDVKDDGLTDLFLYYEHRTLHDWGFDVAYRGSSGTIKINDAAVTNPDYKMSSWTLEGYRYYYTDANHHYGWGPKIGVDRTTRPFVSADTTDTATVYTTQLISPFLGFFLDRQDVHWFLSANVSYYYPLFAQTNSGTYTVTPTVTVKGGVDISYNISSTFRVGVSWQGDLMNNDFVYKTSTSAAGGAESTSVSTFLFTLNILY